MDPLKKDMVGVRVEYTENRFKWKTVIRCGNHEKDKLDGNEEAFLLGVLLYCCHVSVLFHCFCRFSFPCSDGPA